MSPRFTLPSPRIVDVFDRPDGPVHLASDRWWASRDRTGLDADGEVEVQIADGDHVARIKATPLRLRRLAEALVAQADSVEANTP